jgi:GT2 family glycosyltransferase
MSAPSVSVIVVSRGRAADLALCLLGISQLDFPLFEVVLVADEAGLEAARGLPFFDELKTVTFEEANISKARNLGIAETSGEIVAFIDDDAVPEPTWLHYLTAGFSEPEVAVAGGFVRGRNGISFQWKARSVDCFGDATPLDVSEDKISILTPTNGRAIKTEGTNMAVRRDVIAQMGGFDPAYRFYLDETDLNYRMMQEGHRTAIAPLAQVHHGYKASATRRQDRVPTDLTEIGASLAVYLRKFAPKAQHKVTFAKARKEQRVRALRHMMAGLLEPRDVSRLMGSFDKGVEVGSQRAISTLSTIPLARDGFKPLTQRFKGQHVIVEGSWFKRKALRQMAMETVRNGTRTSLFIFSPTLRPHKVRFTKEGVWEQTGGLFGRSVRAGAHVLGVTRKKRVAQELKRLAKLRDFPPKV